MTRIEFIRTLLPHATAAIGKQHPFFVQWAIAKAAQETGWSLDGDIVQQACNVLGIKAEVNGNPIKGVPYLLLRANTGPESGRHVYWRKFPDLTACFGEFVNMMNYRAPFRPFRNLAMSAFENIYTAGLTGHAQAVLVLSHTVNDELDTAGLIDKKGRLI